MGSEVLVKDRGGMVVEGGGMVVGLDGRVVEGGGMGVEVDGMGVEGGGMGVEAEGTRVVVEGTEVEAVSYIHLAPLTTRMVSPSAVAACPLQTQFRS